MYPQVYVLICWADYETEEVWGAYSSFDKAECLLGVESWTKISENKWKSNCGKYEIHRCNFYIDPEIIES